MNRFFFLFYFISIFCYKSSISQQITFEKNYHINAFNHGGSAVELFDNSYMLICNTQTTTPLNHYISLLHIDSIGDTIWQKDYCGRLAMKMFLVSDTNLVIFSSTYCSALFNYEFTKLNLEGDTIWQKFYQSYSNDFAHNLSTTSDKGFLAACGGYAKVFKIDSSGNYLWGMNPLMSVVWSVKETLDKGFVVVGFAPYINSWAIEKYDSAGVYQWGQGYGYNPTGTPEYQFTDVAQLPDSNYIVSGFAPFSISKINHLNGDTIWTKNGLTNAWMKSLALTPTLKIAVAGFSTIAEFDTAGNQLWTKYFPNVELQEIKTTSDGGFIATGDYYPDIQLPYSDAVLIRLDSLGNVTNFIGINPLTQMLNNSYVYPNPVTETALLQFNNTTNGTFQLTITDVQGSLIETKTITGNSIPIIKNNKHCGVYFYRLTNQKTGEMMKGKFVIGK